jgi:hypothetical protein
VVGHSVIAWLKTPMSAAHSAHWRRAIKWLQSPAGSPQNFHLEKRGITSFFATSNAATACAASRITGNNLQHPTSEAEVNED